MLEFWSSMATSLLTTFYHGSARSGYKVLPGAGDQAGSFHDPLDMHALLDANLWDGVLFEEMFDMQAPCSSGGGMDGYRGFPQKTGGHHSFDSPVEQIARLRRRRIVYRNHRTGRRRRSRPSTASARSRSHP